MFCQIRPGATGCPLCFFGRTIQESVTGPASLDPRASCKGSSRFQDRMAMRANAFKVLAAVGVACIPVAARGAWLIGSTVADGVHSAPTVSYVDSHRAGRPFLPLYSDEWRNLQPALRQHILEVWRDMSQKGLQPYFNDGARTTEDSIALAAECSSGAGRCAHPPAVGPNGKHEQGLAVDMQPAGYREDWRIFYRYAQILDANGLYLPLGGSDLPHVELLPTESGNSRLAFVDMFNAAQGFPYGTFAPWSREYMVQQISRSHWNAARQSEQRLAAMQSRIQALQEAARMRDAESRSRAMRLRHESSSDSRDVLQPPDKIWLPAGCVDDVCGQEEWLTPEELKKAIEDEGTGGSSE